jgi:hypothetical protein
MLSLALSGAGVLLLVIAFGVVRPLSAKQLDHANYIGGVTIDQRKVIRRAVLLRGQLPADESLRPIALNLAKQAAQNLPIVLRWQPLVYLGVILATSAFYLFPRAVTQGIVFQCLFLALGIYTLITNLRAIGFARSLLARESAGNDDPAPE